MMRLKVQLNGSGIACLAWAGLGIMCADSDSGSLQCTVQRTAGLHGCLASALAGLSGWTY